MDRYWTKIGVGAVCVFGVGMAGITLAKKGVAELKTAAFGPVQEALSRAPSLLTFRLDGRRVGRVKSIEVANEDGDWNARSVLMMVELEPGRAPDDLASCALATETFSHRKDASFRCVDEAAIEHERLVQVGEIQFEPSAITRPLYLARRDVRQLGRSELRGLKATVASPDGKAIKGLANYDVETSRGNRERGTVRIDASDGRALIEITGEDGRELFRLRADDGGVSISAKDKKGTNVLKLLAGEAGVHLDVKGVEAEKN